MEKVKQVFVVEGRSDEQKLKSIYDCEVIITHGYHISRETIELIKAAAKEKEVILFLDPDRAGNLIRNRLNKEIKNAKNVYIARDKARKSLKYGVEFAKVEDIKEALKYQISFETNYNCLDYQQFLSLNIVGNKKLRLYICEKLHITYANNKTLYKILNYLNIDYQRLKEIIEEFNHEN